MPNLDVNANVLDLEALKEWVKSKRDNENDNNIPTSKKSQFSFAGLKPDLPDFVDFNLDDLAGNLEGQNISEIRRNLVNILKNVFNLIHQYSEYFKKFFYVASLLLLINDAIK